MIICKTVAALSKTLKYLQHGDNTLGFVPTMGALHEGHLSLVQMAKTENKLCICSIFVNPTQFNNPADFEKYPVTIETDVNLLEAAGCDILFLPAVSEIYPAGFQPPHYELGYLETILEGKFRPGHYQGVCQVVDRLLTLISPNNLYLGQKDYQQCMVIEKLVQLRGFSCKIRIGTTVREKDGLAMSSRNTRLNADERKQATAIYKALNRIKSSINNEGISELTATAAASLAKEGFRPDYIEVADVHSLLPLEHYKPGSKAVILAAAYLDEVRLIDNLLIP